MAMILGSLDAAAARAHINISHWASGLAGTPLMLQIERTTVFYFLGLFWAIIKILLSQF
jgi:hypothetical protein